MVGEAGFEPATLWPPATKALVVNSLRVYATRPVALRASWPLTQSNILRQPCCSSSTIQTSRSCVPTQFHSTRLKARTADSAQSLRVKAPHDIVDLNRDSYLID